MTRVTVTLAFVIATSAAAQIPNTGSICGTVLDENGQPAKHAVVVALYLGPHSGPLPNAQSDNTGHYCLENVPFGQNIPSVVDLEHGYPNMWNSFYGSRPLGQKSNDVADLSAARPRAVFDFRIPYKAAFLTIHPTDAITGTPKLALIYRVEVQSDPEHRELAGNQKSSEVLLLPPHENILLKVRAPGYREWPYDGSQGYVLNLLPGERKTIDVPLQPK
jgi:hypothetical protein